MNSMEKRFKGLLDRVPIPNKYYERPKYEQYRVAVETAYKTRPYHNLDHIKQGLDVIADMEDEDLHRGKKFDQSFWDEIRTAFWYHDFSDSIPACVLKVDKVFCSWTSVQFLLSVQGLIQATSHKRYPTDYQTAYICDADLSILGAPEDEFDAYEEKVRQEYAHVPYEMFAAVRIQILKSFYDRPFIYATEYGRTRYQRAAMKNLERSMTKLRESIVVPE